MTANWQLWAPYIRSPERIVVDGAFGAAPAMSVAAAGRIVYRTWPVNPAQLADGQSTAISPDGRWLAYTATAPNRPGTDLRIRPLAPAQSQSAGESQQRVPAEGGRQLAWRADGSELFFDDAAGNTMTVRVHANEQELQVDEPAPLFPADDQSVRFSPDGRFIAFGYRPLVVLLNWAPRS